MLICSFKAHMIECIGILVLLLLIATNEIENRSSDPKDTQTRLFMLGADRNVYHVVITQISLPGDCCTDRPHYQ